MTKSLMTSFYCTLLEDLVSRFYLSRFTNKEGLKAENGLKIRSNVEQNYSMIKIPTVIYRDLTNREVVVKTNSEGKGGAGHFAAKKKNVLR